MKIRPAEISDLPQVLKLYKQLNPEESFESINNEVEATWKTIISNPPHTLYVLEFETNLVSTCALTVVPNLSRSCRPYGLIENVITDGKFRKKGYGSSLLKYVLDQAWRQNCYKVMLMTGSKNPQTLSFYENVGFLTGKKTGLVAYPAAT